MQMCNRHSKSRALHLLSTLSWPLPRPNAQESANKWYRSVVAEPSTWGLRARIDRERRRQSWLQQSTQLQMSTRRSSASWRSGCSTKGCMRRRHAFAGACSVKVHKQACGCVPNRSTRAKCAHACNRTQQHRAHAPGGRADEWRRARGRGRDLACGCWGVLVRPAAQGRSWDTTAVKWSAFNKERPPSYVGDNRAVFNLSLYGRARAIHAPREKCSRFHTHSSPHTRALPTY